MKQSLLTMILGLFTCLAVAQNRTISGTITDSDSGESLPGVTIAIKGTTSGTTTDIDGKYSISVAEGQTLVISYIGFATQEVVVQARTVVDISLSSDVSELSEVVIIGYGATTVKDATGAVASVTAKDFNGGVIGSPEQLIQGKTAGVQITSNSGAPGDGMQIRIRGTNSVRSNNNPLFVVDGVPLSGGVTASPADIGVGTTSDVNPLSFLNPGDIESISILKDASASAIYGSRGANGVVIITTKSGRGAGNRLEFSSSISVASSAKEYDLLKADEAPFFLSGVGQVGGDPRSIDAGFNTDWQDVILRTSVSHKQNLAYSTTVNGTSLRASFGYEDQEGIIENSEMERITGRITAGRSFMSDKLNVNLSLSYSSVNREDPAISGSAGFQGDLLGAAYSANPTWPNDPDFDSGGQRNPANLLAYYNSTATNNRLLSNLSVDYSVTDDLTAKVTYGADYSDAERVTLASGLGTNLGNGVQGFGQGQLNFNENFNNLVEFTLNYKKELTSNINLEVVGGYSYQDFRNQFSWATARGFASDDFAGMESALRADYATGQAAVEAIYPNVNNWGISDDIRNGTETAGGFANTIFPEIGTTYFARPGGLNTDAVAANFYDQKDFLQSYFGRAKVSISDKYLITLTVRGDGSSTFGDDEKYGIFPSAAVAWQMHEEEFIPDFFNTLKLRLGYGVVGNQDGLGYGNFVRRERFADVSIGESREIGVPGTTTQGFANSGLKWEETTQRALGFDFGFLNERLYGSLDFYTKETTDLLFQTQPAQPALSPLTFDNLDAIVENKGWELALGFDAIDNSDVQFSINGNVSQNKNLVKDFAGNLDAGTIRGPGLTGAFAQQLTGGRPLFSYYLREFAGFDQNGQPIRDNQKFVDKSALPEWNAGLSLNLSVNNFDFSAYMAGQFGFYVYNNTANAFFTAGVLNTSRNVTADVLTSGESGSAEAAVSERFLEKGDFIRMQNMSIGYNVPVTDGGLFKNLRFSLNAQNLFLITDYSGLDPEVSTNPASRDLLNGLPTAGIDYTSYPRPRVFTLGLNATF